MRLWQCFCNFSIKESPVLLTVTATLIKTPIVLIWVISAEAKDGTGPYTYQLRLQIHHH
jgi:hypothetical protein